MTQAARDDPAALRRRSRAQWLFRALLEDEGNRSLSVVELCRRAGYTSTTKPWFRALNDEGFRSHLESIGVPVRRRDGKQEPPGLVPLADPDEVWRSDTVDLRRLTNEYPKHVSGANFKLVFTFIANPELRALVKRYFRARVAFWRPATFRPYLKHIKPFFTRLGAQYPDLDSFAGLTRAMIEPVLHLPYWIDQTGQQHPITAYRRAKMAGVLDGMFTYMRLHDWPQAPPRPLIFFEDKLGRPVRRPRPIPESVMQQLGAHLHLLHPYARNLVEILRVAGLRAEDALHLREDCLDWDTSGYPRLRWHNHKLMRDGRPLPVTHEVAQAIERQRELVKDVTDHFDGRYLFRTEYGLYKFDSLCHQLNALANRVPLLGPDGEVYRIRPHAFRHTVGTQMINSGMNFIDVMTYLDHRSPSMTLNYAQIYDETLKNKFKAMIRSGHATGGIALAILKEQIEHGDEELDWVVSNLRRLSLPWGYCLHHAKAPKCPYGQNACFTKDDGPCHKLVTAPEHAPVIVATLADLKKSRSIAKEKGWEMYANDLDDQINGMEQVLSELELPADERQKNRGGQPSK
jgi:integrase